MHDEGYVQQLSNIPTKLARFQEKGDKLLVGFVWGILMTLIDALELVPKLITHVLMVFAQRSKHTFEIKRVYPLIVVGGGLDSPNP